MINKGTCDKGVIWNLSNCDCECDKLCDIGEYLHCQNIKCRKKSVDKLVGECMKILMEIKWFIIGLRIIMEMYVFHVQYI